jgi:hypothetical protein
LSTDVARDHEFNEAMGFDGSIVESRYLISMDVGSKLGSLILMSGTVDELLRSQFSHKL